MTWIDLSTGSQPTYELFWVFPEPTGTPWCNQQHFGGDTYDYWRVMPWYPDPFI